MSAHVTEDAIARMQSGKLAPGGIVEIGRHIESCDACRELVRSRMQVAQAVRDLRIQIDADAAEPEEEEPAQNVEPAPVVPIRPRRNWLPIAIAALLILAFATLLLLRRKPTTTVPSVPAAPQITTTTVAPQPEPTEPSPQYERPEWERLVRNALVSRELVAPAALAALRMAPAQFRGETPDGSFVLAPNGDIVEETAPQLRWTAVDGATYTVLLSEKDDVRELPTGKVNAWTPARPLRRGADYQWQIEVATGKNRELHPQSPQPPARFRILGESAAAEIERARRAHPDDHLLLAVLLAHHGVRLGAERELEQLRATQPEIATALLHSLRSWR